MTRVELIDAIKAMPEYQAKLLPFKRGRSVFRNRLGIESNSIWDKAYSCFSTRNSKFLTSIIDGEYWYDLKNSYWGEKITTKEKITACTNFLRSSQKRRIDSLGEVEYTRIKEKIHEILLTSKYLEN